MIRELKNDLNWSVCGIFSSTISPLTSYRCSELSGSGTFLFRIATTITYKANISRACSTIIQMIKIERKIGTEREKHLKDSKEGTVSCNSLAVEGLPGSEKTKAHEREKHFNQETYCPSTLHCAQPYNDCDTKRPTESDAH